MLFAFRFPLPSASAAGESWSWCQVERILFQIGREWTTPFVKALARAFRWRKLLETGVYGTIEEIAAAEKINSSYISRVLRLTLLAPEIVEAILEGRQPVEMTLAAMMRPLPVVWQEQVRAFLQGSAASGSTSS
jgi:hypothetical protein